MISLYYALGIVMFIMAYQVCTYPDNIIVNGIYQDGLNGWYSLGGNNFEISNVEQLIGSFSVVVTDPIDGEGGGYQPVQIQKELRTIRVFLSCLTDGVPEVGSTGEELAVIVDCTNDVDDVVRSIEPFSFGTHPWETKELYISMSGEIESCNFTASFSGLMGKAYFDDFRAFQCENEHCGSDNAPLRMIFLGNDNELDSIFVEYPSFEEVGGWNLNGETSYSSEYAYTGTKSIKFDNSVEPANSFVDQTITLPQGTEVIHIIGASKTLTYIEGEISDEYAICVEYELDTLEIHHQCVQFSTGMHDWEFKHLKISAEHPITSVTVSGKFGKSGVVLMDHIAVFSSLSPINMAVLASHFVDSLVILDTNRNNDDAKSITKFISTHFTRVKIGVVIDVSEGTNFALVLQPQIIGFWEDFENAVTAFYFPDVLLSDSRQKEVYEYVKALHPDNLLVINNPNSSPNSQHFDVNFLYNGPQQGYGGIPPYVFCPCPLEGEDLPESFRHKYAALLHSADVNDIREIIDQVIEDNVGYIMSTTEVSMGPSFSDFEYFSELLKYVNWKNIGEPCGGISNSESDERCSAHGTCTYNPDDSFNGVCECEFGYRGDYCERIPETCFGVFWYAPEVCNGHGSCSNQDTCECSYGFAGDECDDPACFGIPSFSNLVCSGHGSCEGTDDCQCDVGSYYAPDCVTKCYSVFSNDTNVCSGHGVCSDTDNCICIEGYIGNECETSICNDIPEDQPGACNSRGTCSDRFCSCASGYMGSYCQFVSCNGVGEKVPTVCSGHGRCVDIDQCACDPGYGVMNCDEYTCFGIFQGNSSVCSGNGDCVDIDECLCDDNFGGLECDIPSCDGILASDSNVCNGKGNCSAPNHCVCESGHTGTSCQYPVCYGEGENACHGHGQCILPDFCKCDEGSFGMECEHHSCFLYAESDPKVCSGHGKCEDTNVCSCSNGYQGENCEISICNSILSSEDEVCSGHGTCIGHNSCECSMGWSGRWCQHAICFGKSLESHSESEVCNGYNCLSPNICSCSPELYLFSNCSLPICFGKSYLDPDVCNGRGKCSDPGVCECQTDSYGSQCQYLHSFFLDPQNETSTFISNVDTYMTSGLRFNTNSFKLFGDVFTSLQLSSNAFLRFGNSYSGTDATLGSYSYPHPIIFLGHQDTDLRGPLAHLNKIFYRQSREPPSLSQQQDLQKISNLIRTQFKHDDRFNSFQSSWYFCFTFDGIGQFEKKFDKPNFVQAILTVDESKDLSFIIINFRNEGIQHPEHSPVIGIAPRNGGNGIVDLSHIADATSRKSEKLILSSNVQIPGMYIFPTHESSIPQGQIFHHCFDVSSDNPQVCSGHGKCVKTDLCRCEPYHSGPNCDIDCTEQTNYVGEFCQVPVCFGRKAYENQVCSGHGECIAPDTCSCSSGYFSSDCGGQQCYGLSFSNPDVCSGHGTCADIDSCTCDRGYVSQSGPCRDFTCDGLNATLAGACAKGGTCVGLDKCDGCDLMYFGDDCLEAYRYLSPNGNDFLTDGTNDENECLYPAFPCRTINHIFSVSTNNNHILVASGTYEFPIKTMYLSHNLNFVGEGAEVKFKSKESHPSDVPHFAIHYQQRKRKLTFKNIEFFDIAPQNFVSLLYNFASEVHFDNVRFHSLHNLIHAKGSIVSVLNNVEFFDQKHNVLSLRDISMASSMLNMTNVSFHGSGMSDYPLIFLENIDSVYLSSCTFEEYLSMQGSAIYFTQGTNFIGEHLLFLGMKAQYHASSMYIEKVKNAYLQDITIRHSQQSSGTLELSEIVSLKIDDIVIEDSSSDSFGSGLVLHKINTFDIKNYQCHRNVAQIYSTCVSATSSTGRIANSAFLDNRAQKAIAVYSEDSNVDLYDVVIMKQISLESFDYLSGNGSAILLSGRSHFRAFNSEFLENNVSIISIEESSFLFDQVNFTHNMQAAVQIIHNSAKENSTIINSNFHDNVNLFGFGGSISSFEVFNSLFISGCTFESSKSVTGGAISSVVHDKVYVSNSSFTNCSCTQNGGAIYLENVNITEISDTRFINNMAKNGGALFLQEVVQSRFFVRMGGTTLYGCHFERNHAHSDGGSIALANENVFRAVNSTFIENSAFKSGGTVHADGVAYMSETNLSFEEVLESTTLSDLLNAPEIAGMVFEACYFSSNEADIGGAITTFSNNIRFQLMGSTFEKNLAYGDGGSLYVFSRHSDIVTTSISDSSALRGGCIFVLMTREPTDVRSSQLSNCISAEGGIYIAIQTTLQFYDSVLESCKSTTGAIFSSGRLNLDSSTLRDNHATENGGAITISNVGETNIVSSSLLNNSAPHGGVIYTTSYDLIHIEDTNSVNNEAQLGAVIYFDHPLDEAAVPPSVRNLNVINSYFRDIATVAGGLFFNYRDVLVDREVIDSIPLPTQALPSNIYGPRYASNPVSIVFKKLNTIVKSREIQENETMPLDATFTTIGSDPIPIFPGQLFEVYLEFRDEYDQVVSQYPELTMQIIAEGAQMLAPSTERVIENSEIYFIELQLFGKIGSTASITFSSRGIEPSTPSLTIPIIFVECPRGHRAEYLSDDTVSCLLCLRGEYSIRKNQEVCASNCVNFECEGSSIVAFGGYWIDVLADGRLDAKPCPNAQCVGGELRLFSDHQGTPIPRSLLEGDDSLTGKRSVVASNASLPSSQLPILSFEGSHCRGKRRGILCATCEGGYSEWRGSCVPCQNANAGMIVGLLFYFFIILFYVHFSSQDSKGDASIKIFVAFCQTTFQIVNFPQWASTQREAFFSTGTAYVFRGISSLFSLQLPQLSPDSEGLPCPFDRPGLWYYNAQLLQHLLSVSCVILAFIFSTPFCACYCSPLMKKDSKKPYVQLQARKETEFQGIDQISERKFDATTDPEDSDSESTVDEKLSESTSLSTFSRVQSMLKMMISRLIWSYYLPHSYFRTLINIAIYTYQPVVLIVFSYIFGCFKTGSGRFVFITRSDAVCWHGTEYWVWTLLYFLVLIYLFSIPILSVLFLLCFRKYLNNEKFKLYFGPLYDIYKPNFFWFESVSFLRKLFLIGGGVIANALILAYGIQGIQFILYALLLSINYTLVHMMDPYKKKSDNFMEKFSLFVTVFMLSIQEGTSEVSEAVGVVAAMILTFFSVILFVSYIILQNWFVKLALKKLKDRFRKEKIVIVPEMSPQEKKNIPKGIEHFDSKTELKPVQSKEEDPNSILVVHPKKITDLIPQKNLKKFQFQYQSKLGSDGISKDSTSDSSSLKMYSDSISSSLFLTSDSTSPTPSLQNHKASTIIPFEKNAVESSDDKTYVTSMTEKSNEDYNDDALHPNAIDPYKKGYPASPESEDGSSEDSSSEYMPTESSDEKNSQDRSPNASEEDISMNQSDSSSSDDPPMEDQGDSGSERPSEQPDSRSTHSDQGNNTSDDEENLQ